MDKTIRVLLAEDEAELALIIKESLSKKGFEIVVCRDGAHALAMYTSLRPDVLVLDVMMPKMDGFTLAREIRKTDLRTPILFLTARTLTSDVVSGFEAGGNDYLRKPFSMDELIVRVKALSGKPIVGSAQKADIPVNRELSIGQYVFNPVRQTLAYDGNEELLTYRECEVLLMLYDNLNAMVLRSLLLTQIWGDDDFFTGRSMDVFISKLRKKLSHDPAVKIMNLRGFGYKLVF